MKEEELERIAKAFGKLKDNKKALTRAADILEGIATGIEIANADKRNRNNDNRVTE